MGLLMSKKILLTGASGGIGKGISEKLNTLNHKIIFTSSNDQNLEKLKHDFGNDH